MLGKSVPDYVDAGCELARPLDLFVALFAATHEDPCHTGCAYFRDGRCPAFVKMFPDQAGARRRNRIDDARVTARLDGNDARRQRETTGQYPRPAKRAFKW